MPIFRQFSDGADVAMAVEPQSLGTGDDTSAAIDMTGYARAALVVAAGALGSSATVDCKVQASATSDGSYADIPGVAITQMEDGTDDNTVQIVDFEIPAGKPHLKVVTTVGTAASLVAAFVVKLGDRRG